MNLGRCITGFTLRGEDNARTVEDIMQKVVEFAVGQVNVSYERFNFFFTKGAKKRKNHLRTFTQRLEG